MPQTPNGKTDIKALALEQVEYVRTYKKPISHREVTVCHAFEEILKKLGGQTVMNVHVKPIGEDYPKEHFRTIISLIEKYDCERYCYLMIEKDNDIKWLRENYPNIPICVGHDFDRNWAIVDRAIETGAQKVQFFKPYVNKEMIDKAHENGIICNVFWSDDQKETSVLLKMGIDTILTNDFNLISQLFFDNDHFYRFRERCDLAGINVPIEAGIMPVLNKKQIELIAHMLDIPEMLECNNRPE